MHAHDRSVTVDDRPSGRRAASAKANNVAKVGGARAKPTTAHALLNAGFAAWEDEVTPTGSLSLG